MKRVRCPKCDRYVIFDENRYKDGQNLVFECPNCGKQFSIRIGVSKLNNIQREENLSEQPDNNKYGYINKEGKIVIPFQYDDASSFRNNIAIVQQDHYLSVINTQGKILFDFPRIYKSRYILGWL